MCIYWSVHVSNQSEGRQRIALRGAGTTYENVHIVGQGLQPAEAQKLMRKTKRDDLLCIKSTDRPGRDYAEILKQRRFTAMENRKGKRSRPECPGRPCVFREIFNASSLSHRLHSACSVKAALP